MRNRFQNYVQSPYISQFVPNPMDYQTTVAPIMKRQLDFDQTLAALEAYDPNIQYITDPDITGAYSHAETAKNLNSKIQADIDTSIQKMYESDNLSGGARDIYKIRNNKEYREQIAALKTAKDQYDAYNTFMDKEFVKDPEYNTMKEFYRSNAVNPFSTSGNLVNAPLTYLTPKIDEKAKRITDAMMANGFEYNGKNFRTDGSGKFYMSENGKQKQITFEEAQLELSAALRGDPEVAQYAEAWYRMGRGEEFEHRLNSLIGGFASAKAFTDTSQGVDRIGDPGYDRDAAANKLPPRTGFTPFNVNPTQVATVDVGSDGKVIVSEDWLRTDPEYQRLKKEAERLTKTASGEDEVAKSRREKAIRAANDYKKDLVSKAREAIKSKYPNFTEAQLAEYISAHQSGQGYIEKLLDEFGNQVEGTPRDINEFTTLNIYEVTPTGLELADKDLVEDIQNSDTKGKVLQTGLNYVSNISTSSASDPDAPNVNAISGIPLQWNNRQFVVADPNSFKDGKYNGFNRIASMQLDPTRVEDIANVEGEYYYARKKVVPGRTPEILTVPVDLSDRGVIKAYYTTEYVLDPSTNQYVQIEKRNPLAVGEEIPEQVVYDENNTLEKLYRTVKVFQPNSITQK